MGECPFHRLLAGDRQEYLVIGPQQIAQQFKVGRGIVGDQD
jgi:hypothetical protein